MTNKIHVNIVEINQTENLITSLEKKIKFDKNALLLISSECYQLLTISANFISGIGLKCFLNYNCEKNTRTYIALSPLYAANCYVVEEFNSANVHCNFNFTYPTSITYVCVENEFSIMKNYINLHFIQHSTSESPVTFIMEDFEQYENSIFILSKNCYKLLIRNANTVSMHKNMIRLCWQPDVEYAGGQIMLHSINNGNLFFIECMDFSFFKASFTVHDLPKNIYFIY